MCRAVIEDQDVGLSPVLILFVKVPDQAEEEGNEGDLVVGTSQKVEDKAPI